MVERMFSGIVEKTAPVASIVDRDKLRLIELETGWGDVALGQSVAVNGACLTVARIHGSVLGFDVIAETLDKTNLGALRPGDRVNVERSIRSDTPIDGHFVQGHVDCAARLIRQTVDATDWRLTIERPAAVARFLAPKGSICLDGVSLTLAALRDDSFDVALIPTTIERTTLGDRPPGWRFNLEADILSKTVVNWLEQRFGTADHKFGG